MAGTPFLLGWKVPIWAGLGMSVLDWTVNNFNCLALAVNRYQSSIWQSFNLFQIWKLKLSTPSLIM